MEHNRSLNILHFLAMTSFGGSVHYRGFASIWIRIRVRIICEKMCFYGYVYAGDADGWDRLCPEMQTCSCVRTRGKGHWNQWKCIPYFKRKKLESKWATINNKYQIIHVFFVNIFEQFTIQLRGLTMAVRGFTLLVPDFYCLIFFFLLSVSLGLLVVFPVKTMFYRWNWSDCNNHWRIIIVFNRQFSFVIFFILFCLRRRTGSLMSSFSKIFRLKYSSRKSNWWIVVESSIDKHQICPNGSGEKRHEFHAQNHARLLFTSFASLYCLFHYLSQSIPSTDLSFFLLKPSHCVLTLEKSVRTEETII